MRGLIAVAVLMLVAGCGGAEPGPGEETGPLCVSAAGESAFIQGCMAEGAQRSYCACGWGQLAERYECGDMGQATAAELMEICRTCGGCQ
jgi:hypothetical protein